ncbi:hypothetical protein C8Q75DRAFT_103922 [Abortiporus biennis]|nr:hypothetical protein C8Q75DRAFT_103922 [Abortiporus biennis]
MAMQETSPLNPDTANNFIIRLPVDILLPIFTDVTNAHWRIVIHQSPLLWASIALRNEITKSGCLDFILSRAQKVPLQVYAYLDHEGDLTESEDYFFECCLKEFNHIERLSWHRLPYSFLPAITRMIQASANTDPFIFPALHLPNLEFLRVQGYAVLAVLPVIWPSIKVLHFGGNCRDAMGPRSSHLLVALTGAPFLEELHIINCVSVCDGHPASIHLPYLRTLKIREFPQVLLELLRLIAFPDRNTVVDISSSDKPIDDNIFPDFHRRASSMLANVQNPHTASIIFSESWFSRLPHV